MINSSSHLTRLLLLLLLLSREDCPEKIKQKILQPYKSDSDGETKSNQERKEINAHCPTPKATVALY